ncbi:MAG: hypothetical protein DPW09_24815 [Anaerolineae bacterium]|nr:hypothetical protein [Anaerolineae bacterium]
MLGLGYSTLTPIFENSDETLHYPYVKHLADGRGLPLAIPGQLWGQEGTQPPLYYGLVAATTSWIDSDNLPELLQPNPHWLFTEVRSLINDNQNRVLHGLADAFPYRRAALAIHIGRWWSLAFGLLAIITTFFLARYLFPYDLPLTLTATALVAFNPQFIRVAATVSNDSLSVALTTLTVLAALKFTSAWPLVQPGNRRETIVRCVAEFRPLLLGLLAGLALLTKLSGGVAMFLATVIICWRLFFLRKKRQTALPTVTRWLAFMSVITAILIGWWFLRNYLLYGEWLALETHLNLAGRGTLSLVEVWNLRAEVERAYWATFGWGQIRPPEWVYRLFAWATRLGLIGLTVALLGKLVLTEKVRSLLPNLEKVKLEPIILLLLWAVLNLTLYLRWVMEVGSVSHSRLIFPAIAPISLLLALGWHAWLPRRLAGWFNSLVIILLLTLNVYSLGWLIYPAFTPSPLLDKPAGEPVASRRVNWQIQRDSVSEKTTIGSLFSNEASSKSFTFLKSLELCEAQVYSHNQSAAMLKPIHQVSQGDTIIVEALWRTLAPLDKNYSVAVVLLSPAGDVLARRETYPGLGLRPTRTLRFGDTFRDLYPLKLEGNVAEPIVARATINLFDFDSASRAGFPALDAAGNEVTPMVGQIKVVPSPWPRHQPSNITHANFGNVIALIGYDLHPPTSKMEARSSLILYWQSLIPAATDYILFLHLLDANGNLITQADAPPTNNAYPTSWWSPGEIIADRHLLPALTGPTTLRLGLYDLASGQRLPVTKSTLPGGSDSVEILLP